MHEEQDNGAVAAAVQLAGVAASRPSDGGLDDFVQTYRDWIVAHHDLPGSREERVERTHLLLHAIAAAVTVEEAVARLARFRRLVWGDRGLSLTPRGGHLVLLFDQPLRTGVAGLVSDLWSLAFTLTELEFLGGGRFEGVSGQVRQDAVLPAATVALLFDRPVAFAADALSLAIPVRHMERPVVPGAREVEAFLCRLVPSTIGATHSAPTVMHLVAGILRADRLHRSDEMADLPSVAARLGFSAPTLRRRLAAEGCSFRTLKEDTYDALARAWLTQGWEVAVIAERLGYSDAFAFRRAFHRRHACSPSTFRRQAALSGAATGGDGEGPA